MNDIVLSGLVNVFALYGSYCSVDKSYAIRTLSDYMTHHYGVRDVQYLDSYKDLSEAYEQLPRDERLPMAHSICRQLCDKVSSEGQLMLLLRLMEFLPGGVDGTVDEQLYRPVADIFGVSDDEFEAAMAFLKPDGEHPSVKLVPYEGTGGCIRALYVERFNLLLYRYTGTEEVLMNDVPLMDPFFQVWLRSGVMKCAKGKTLYYFNIKEPFKRSLAVASTPIKLRGNHIEFRFDEHGDNGLHDFTFNLYNGELVAIMGGSGVGKSTLLSLLTGTLHPQQGAITINGHPITEPAAKALIGYVPQDDLLVEELTIYQNLWFTAKFAFSNLTDIEIDQRVMNTLCELGLDAVKDLRVGSPINKYISGGQRKRLNIALELIREPAILYLDEPTSGLSSADSEKVVNLLKEQAFKGKLVIANIHQPSSDVFKLFDRLWLLDKGGYPIFDGNPIEAVTYFKRAANYVDADVSTCPCCGNVNPEVILNIIDEKERSATGEPTQRRVRTPREWHELYLKTAPKSKTKVEPLPSTKRQSPNRIKQTWLYLRRNIQAKITNLQYICITLLEAPVMAFLCALFTHYAPEEGYSVMNNSNMVSFYFMAVIVAVFMGMSGSAEEIFKDRALLKREKFLSLSYSSYIWSKIIFVAALALIQTLLFVVVGKIVMGIHGMFFLWWMVLFAVSFLSALIGLWLSQTLNSIVSIYITVPLLLIPQILLCGLVISFSDLNPKSTTGNVPLIGDIIPSRWAFEALAVGNFVENDYETLFFDYDREKYEAQYYRLGYLSEVKSQLETRRNMDSLKAGMYGADDAYTTVVKHSLPVIADVCNMRPYEGDYGYESVKAYLDDAEDILAKRSNAASLAQDRQVRTISNKLGKTSLKQLKKDNYNLQLEQVVACADAKEVCKVVSGYIVPQSGFVYVKPLSHNGRAPFYSSEKIIGSWHIYTVWYNIGVLLLMCVVVSLCLFFEFPRRLITARKKNN